MLKLADLKDGEVYYIELNLPQHCNPIWIQKWKGSAIDKVSKTFQEDWNKFGNNTIPLELRLATDEEKAWLQHCIKEDKFVEYEEFMKVYKPQFIIGQWYKIELSHTYNHFIKFKSFDDINGYIDNLGYIKNLNKFTAGNSLKLKSITKYELLADLNEIQEFLPLDHPDKQLDIKQIQEECKKRFPIGCKFKCANTKNESILRQDEIVYEINDSSIYASGGQGCLYYKGKYAELIETLEMIIPEYVEYVNTLYKGTIVKVEDWCCGSYCKVIFYNGNKEQPFKHLVKYSTKSAYDLQNLKQQPLTPEQCYNTEIEVGDEVECVEGIGHHGIGFNLGLKFIVHSISNYEPEKCYFGGVGGNGVYKNHLKLIKKANKNTTTTTLNKKVDVSSPKVTDKITVPRINTTSYDTLVHINIETNTKSIKIPKLETNTPEIKKIKIQSLTLTI